jgi:hypothetical protein
MRPGNRPATLLLAFGFFLGFGGNSAAQSSPESLHPEIGVARWYAPIVWPAVNETVWPTLPHALAFDGLDNDGNNLKDLEDPFEVSFGFDEEKLEDLISAFQGLKKKPPPRVVYSGPSRFEKDQTIDVLQYWFYYFYDQGPASHRHDPEHAFVFLDVLPKGAPSGGLSRYDYAVDRETHLSNAVRIVAGGAHEGSTVNNVLAVARGLDKTRVVPRQLPSHMPILVELGKHASAPDLNLDGRFDPGMDANVLRGSLWGLRDSFAAGIGELGFLSFQGWQSFPRRTDALLAEEAFFRSNDQNLKNTYEIYAPGLRSAKPYSLFPLQDLQDLYKLLSSGGDQANLEGEVLSFLRQHKECFWGDAASAWSGRVDPKALAEMQKWASRRQAHMPLWEHPDYKRPDDIFKLHLYPRWTVGAGTVWEAGGHPTVSRIMTEVSDVKWPRWELGPLTLLFPGRLFTSSRLELTLIGTESLSRPAAQYFGVTWKKGRGNRAGPYFGIQARREHIRPGTELPDKILDEISEQTGVDKNVLKNRERSKRWPVGIRMGLAIGHSIAQCQCRFETHVGIVLEPQTRNIGEVDRALGARENVRFQIGASLFWNVPKFRPEPWKY